MKRELNPPSYFTHKPIANRSCQYFSCKVNKFNDISGTWLIWSETVCPAPLSGRMTMKYVISWFERPQGSPMEYENAQKRILEVFGQWKAPGNFKIEFFVIRVGEWGGHMLMECDDPVTIHKFCSMLP